MCKSTDTLYMSANMVRNRRRDQCVSDRVPARTSNLETRLGRYIYVFV